MKSADGRDAENILLWQHTFEQIGMVSVYSIISSRIRRRGKTGSATRKRSRKVRAQRAGNGSLERRIAEHQ